MLTPGAMIGSAQLKIQDLQAQSALEQIQMQYADQKKQIDNIYKLKSMANLYNERPKDFNETEAAYIREMAPKYNLDISEGLKKDTGTFGEKAIGFAGGVADSFLFDLLPDNIYETRYNKGWTTAGKWGGTLASLAMGGVGAFNAIKAARLAKSAANPAIIGTSGKVLQKLLAENTDDFVKIFGDDFAKTIEGKSLAEIEKLAKKAAYESGGMKNVKSLYAQYFSKEELDAMKKAWKKAGPLNNSNSLKRGKKKLLFKNGERNPDILSIKKLEKKITETFDKAVESPQQFTNRIKGRITKLENEIKTGEQWLELVTGSNVVDPVEDAKQAASIVARINKNKLAIAEAKKALRSNSKLRVAEDAIRSEIARRALQDAELLASRSQAIKSFHNLERSIVKNTSIIRKNVPASKVSSLLGKYIDDTGGVPKAEVKKEIKQIINSMSDEEKQAMYKNAVKIAAKEEPKISSKLSPAAKLAAQEQYRAGMIKRKKYLAELEDMIKESFLKKAARIAKNNLVAPSMAHSMGKSLANFNSLSGLEKAGAGFGALLAIPMIAGAPIRNMAPTSYQQAAQSPYGIFAGLVGQGGVAAQNMSNLPQLPPTMLQQEDEVNQMLQQ